MCSQMIAPPCDPKTFTLKRMPRSSICCRNSCNWRADTSEGLCAISSSTRSSSSSSAAVATVSVGRRRLAIQPVRFQQILSRLLLVGNIELAGRRRARVGQFHQHHLAALQVIAHRHQQHPLADAVVGHLHGRRLYAIPGPAKNAPMTSTAIAAAANIGRQPKVSQRDLFSILFSTAAHTRLS